MQFSIQLIAAFAAAIAPIQALPAPGTTDNSANKIFAREFSDDCSSKEISCNGEANWWWPSTTPIEMCRRVIASLQENEIRTQPRSHCIMSHERKLWGSQCCISWSHEVPRNTPYTEFKEVAQTILNTCEARKSFDGHISGQMHEVKIGGVCMQVCLSGKSKGCKPSD